MKIYAFLYNPMVEESSYEIVSLHTTREGAYQALIKHRQKKAEQYNEYIDKLDEVGKKYASKFGKWEDWTIEEMEVLE